MLSIILFFIYSLIMYSFLIHEDEKILIVIIDIVLLYELYSGIHILIVEAMY